MIFTFNVLFKLNVLILLFIFYLSCAIRSQGLLNTSQTLINNAQEDYSRSSRLTFTRAQLRLRAELEKTTKSIEELDKKIVALSLKGATYSGKTKIDKEMQELDSKRKKLLEIEKKQTETVSDQYVMVQDELAKLRNEVFGLKKTVQLGDQYQVSKELDFVNYQIKQYEELANILYPQKAREEKLSKI